MNQDALHQGNENVYDLQKSTSSEYDLQMDAVDDSSNPCRETSEENVHQADNKVVDNQPIYDVAHNDHEEDIYSVADADSAETAKVDKPRMKDTDSIYSLAFTPGMLLQRSEEEAAQRTSVCSVNRGVQSGVGVAVS